MKKIKFLALIVMLFGGLLFFGITPKAQAAYPPFKTPMGLGSTGTEVSQLQSFLSTDPGIYPAREVSGYFGPLTKKAVIQFQLTYGILAQGYVGPVTLAQLNEINSKNQMLDTHAPLISGVMTTSGNLQTLNSFATVTWSTSEPVKGGVFLSATPIRLNNLRYFTGDFIYPNSSEGGSLIQSNSGADLTSTKSVNQEGLIPGSTYYYLVESLDNSGNLSISWPKTFTVT